MPVSGFVKLFKRHYGEYSGQSDGEKWITNTTKGGEIKWRDKEHPENSFPIYKDGAFVRKILLDERVNVETLVCLERK